MKRRAQTWILSVLLLIAATPSPWATAASDCAKHFRFFAVQGILVDPPAGADRAADYYKLGEGLGGGVVHRVVPHDQALPAYVRKEYLSETRQNGDLRALHFLRTLPPEVFPIRIIRALKNLPPTTVHLEYVPGRTLNDIMLDPEVPAEIKQNLKQRYLEAIRRFNEETLKRPDLYMGRECVFETQGIPAGFCLFVGLLDLHNPPIELFIKSDNIIVDPDTYEMTLIDPY